ncbi:MAG: hypothetical protein RMK45_11050 [Armatimonadota bacterium]|nr:hypothetical protein [Armatimonadota bacterium]
MSGRDSRALIWEGLRDLPEGALTEIASYVWLVRKRVLTPKAFEDELDRSSRAPNSSKGLCAR